MQLLPPPPPPPAFDEREQVVHLELLFSGMDAFPYMQRGVSVLALQARGNDGPVPEQSGGCSAAPLPLKCTALLPGMQERPPLLSKEGR